jgi:hypothetical protein
MNAGTYKPAKLFTVDEANAMLPLVSAITKDLVDLYQEVLETQGRLEHLTSRGETEERSDPYADEIAEMEHELDRDREKLRHYVAELMELGVEPKGPAEGLIDFPAMMEGRIVYLCWKLGEPEVLYWHDLEAGFAGRQSLTAAAVDGDPSSN